LVLRTNLGVAVKIFRLWFTKLLDIDDREKTFFFFSFLSFVFRRNLDETPISSAGRLCISFCKGIKIEFGNPFQLLKVYQPFLLNCLAWHSNGSL
jgi:hypothetical protein